MPNELLEAALAYARSGWHVFPVEPPRIGDPKSGKQPIGSLVPKGKDDATTDEQLINAWWAAVPNANIGIATARSGLVVLDVDVNKGKLGRESLAQLEAISPLPDTLIAHTGGGGLHAIYARPDGVQPFTRIDVRPGIDLIGNGYIVATPSRHYSGGSYAWASKVAIAPLPTSLLELQRPTKALAHDDLGSESIVEGGRNNAMFKLGCALRQTAIGRDALLAALHFENTRRFKPPLDDAELVQIVDSVMTRAEVSRDVAAGAVAAEAVRDVVASLAPETTSAWLRDVAAKTPPPMRFFDTGVPQLNELLGGGLASRHVCGVVGPPSVGKSAFVGSVCLHVQQFIPILHVSTELPRDELLVRYAALRMGHPWRDGMKGLIDRRKQLDSVRDLRIKLIGCDDLAGKDAISVIVAEALAVEVECGEKPLIVIDYVQLLARGTEEGTRSRVGELTMRIRIMAQALDVPVIAVFSTNRGFYASGKLEQMRATADPTAYLAAAKESGDIEFDCATILFLDVDRVHEGQPKPARIVVARCRVGDIGFAGMRAHLDSGKFVADPAAASEMLAENVSAERAEKQTSLDDDRVLAGLRRFKDRPWRELRKAVGVTVQRADDARRRLLESGRITEVSETYYDTLHRAQKRVVLREVVAGNEPAPPSVVTAEGKP